MKDLRQDPRFLAPRHYLRALYKDPIGKRRVLVHAPGGGEESQPRAPLEDRRFPAGAQSLPRRDVLFAVGVRVCARSGRNEDP